ncbi:hypothetical protein GM418_01960 [Maribellus comscasis]|uniref:Uncharacterized protein n=1 Tax=Maribellus comscasis TaxID=2681766 RepID=A0A6I6JNB6_9BACT|nr:hypothetical protein [Maribellus comscasis]QGY42460.1 hypothetical protein GM418_01960 [Maribellus comscasis]
MKTQLAFMLSIFLFFSCDDSKNKEPEFKIQGCGEEQIVLVEDAVSQVTTTGLKQMTDGNTLTGAQKKILKKICSLSVSITVICKECGDEDPNPCAYSQPNLPLLQNKKRITVNQFIRELQRQGGIVITICFNGDGSIPSSDCTNAIHSTRDLRTIILHELNHYAINDPDARHRSSTWTDVEEVDWDK